MLDACRLGWFAKLIFALDCAGFLFSVAGNRVIHPVREAEFSTPHVAAGSCKSIRGPPVLYDMYFFYFFYDMHSWDGPP